MVELLRLLHDCTLVDQVGTRPSWRVTPVMSAVVMFVFSDTTDWALMPAAQSRRPPGTRARLNRVLKLLFGHTEPILRRLGALYVRAQWLDPVGIDARGNELRLTAHAEGAASI